MTEPFDQGLNGWVCGDKSGGRELCFERYVYFGIGFGRVDTLRLSLRDTVPGELFAVALPLLTLPLPCWQQCKSICRRFTIP